SSGKGTRKFHFWRQLICGGITDPLLETSKNPYSSAMDAGDPVVVKAKALFQDARVVKLYISDVVI
ncbi:MAG TPA: hypothetical protein VFL63_08710, partial [Rhodanobacteraceae bacterium]|nr:hypothetical protein [Rhodanobacteraceae bacterium]